MRASASSDLDRGALRFASQAASRYASQDAFGAVRAIARAVRMDPAEPEWRRLSGFYHTCVRDYDMAGRQLKRAMELAPGDARGRRLIAQLAFLQGRFSEAAARLKPLSRRFAQDIAQDEFLRGLLLGRLGRWGETRAVLQSLSVRWPAWGDLLSAHLAAMRGDWDAAVSASESAASRPGTFDDPRRLGLALRLFKARRWMRRQRPKERKSMPKTATAKAAGRLFLIGVGIDPPRNMTLAMFEALEACDLVFVNLASDSLMELIALTTKAEVRAIVYSTEQSRKRCADEIVASIRPGRTVGYVTIGNVMVFGPLTDTLLGRCRAAGVETRAWPGVSIMDGMLASMGLVLGETFPGFQVFDERDLATAGFAPNPRAPLVLYLSNQKAGAAAKLGAAVQESLLRAYPPGHPCFIFKPETDQAAPPRLAVKDYAERRVRFDAKVQVFIPHIPSARKW